MVVKRLETFAESIDGGMVSINLKDMIERESLRTGRRPTVMLDASSIFCAFEDEDNCFHYNGQPSISKMKVEKFVKKIISCGANLIVFLRGGLDKRSTIFAEDKFNYLIKADLIIKADTVKVGTIKPISANCIKRTFALISDEHYQVFTAIKKTHVEVANVAIREQCLAVIGQDSNYLIYDGVNNYISARTLNVETLDCKIYDKKRVMEYLGLDSFQMPMFATLCGNDIVPHYFLKKFHAKISKFTEIKNRKETILLHVAKEVQHGNRIIQNGSNDPYKLVKYFVELIGDSQIKDDVITKSLNMYLKYEENEYDNEQLKFLINKVANCKLDILPLKIIINREINSQLFTGIVDRRLTSYLLFRPLRRKIYGVLIPKVSLNLFHELDTVIHEYFIEEMLMCKFQQKTPVTVTPLVPHCKSLD